MAVEQGGPWVIDPFNPTVLASYRGVLDIADGNVAFPSVHHASSWASTCGIESRCTVVSVGCMADRCVVRVSA